VKSGNLNFLEPSGPLQACNGTALLYKANKTDCSQTRYVALSIQTVKCHIVTWMCLVISIHNLWDDWKIIAKCPPNTETQAQIIGHRFRAIWHRATSFFGGLWKSRVYANKPQTIPELEAEIRRVIGEIEPQLCGTVIENFVKRARVCQQSRGGLCRILCSTINRSVCNLCWNKNISTFWINGAFYYKIKSCALVGTPYTFWFFLTTKRLQSIPSKFGT
jgi:hypothetical protein